MKRLGIAVLLVAALAAPATAGQVQIGYPGSNYGLYQTGVGGEFTLRVISGLDTSDYGILAKNVGLAGTFQTFCIEGTEYIYPYGAEYYTQLTNKAMYGGSGQPVSQGTGWLYSQFAQGTLAPYNYQGTPNERKSSADALQKAIWWLEGQEPTIAVYDVNNAYMQAILDQFSNLATAQGTGADGLGAARYGVHALNLWANGDNTGAAQDQLFYDVPDGGATLMLLGGALMGIGALRRKFRA